MQAVARRGGRLRLPQILVKTLAAAIVIGAGGSAAAEGPVAVLGAGTASGTGRSLRFRAERLRLLVGCGAAVTRSALGVHSALIRMPPVHGDWRLPDLAFAAGLGMLGGLVSVAYTRGIWLGRDLLARIPIAARVAVAAIVVAGIYTVLPTELLGVGTLDVARLAGSGVGLLLLLVAGKIVATSLTIGAAEVGGLFAPAIIAGAALGGAVGVALHLLGVGNALGPAGYSLLGMTAVVAGSAHAPLTAIFIVLEMSGDWTLILPLLLAGSLSYVTARGLYPNSVYSEWLARRGERISHGTDEGVLDRIRVAQALNPAPVTLRAGDRLADALRNVAGPPRTEYPVLDAGGRLTGVLTFEDWHRALLDPAAAGVRTVGELASPPTDIVTTNDSLLEALRRMGTRDAPQLPVVSANGDGRLVGVIGRKEIFAAYEAALG